MVTGSNFDVLLFMAIILLLLATFGAAFWPPHRHVFDEKTAEHWDWDGHHYECRKCVCGKRREFVTLLEEQS